jgi:hypothetical protein
MAMNLSQLTRFMNRVDVTLEGLFPGVIRLEGVEYACTCVGGSAMTEYLEDGGQAPAGTRFFRVQKEMLATRPETGTRIEWFESPGSVVRLTVMDCPDRPHESAWVLRCSPSDR